MSLEHAWQSVKSLTANGGFPLSRAGFRRSTLSGWIALGLVLFAVALTLTTVTTALNDVPVSGALQGPPSRIDEVLPGSPAWRSGVREGGLVLSVEPGPTAETWVMVTEYGKLAASGMVTVLRDSVPMALLAVILAALALGSLPFDPRIAAAVAAVAVALTERSMMATGDLALSTISATAAIAVPALWFGYFLSRRVPWGVLIASIAIGGAAFWLGARFVAPGLFDIADVSRIGLTYGLAVGIVVVVLGGAVRAAYGGYDMRRLVDVILLSLVVCILVVGLLLGVQPEPFVLMVLVPLLAYPVIRGRTRRTAERLVLGDMRQRAAVVAVEQEHERLAREIHDEPLQRLAAVAQRLDAIPGMATEADIVRSVSDQLRGMVVQLHPPVLMDLGLVPALADLAVRAGRDAGMVIGFRVEDATGGIDAPRAPDDVELAAYRIVQEALSNAILHSGAQQIVVTGRASADVIELSVRDDGVGIDAVAVREAVPRGHVGLHTMADRAELIGAELRIEKARPGTRVVLTWPT